MNLKPELSFQHFSKLLSFDSKLIYLYLALDVFSLQLKKNLMLKIFLFINVCEYIYKIEERNNVARTSIDRNGGLTSAEPTGSGIGPTGPGVVYLLY